MTKYSKSIQKAIQVFKAHGGIMRTKTVLEEGVHGSVLYSMKKEGIVEKLSWGLYYLVDSPPGDYPDLVKVSMKAPNSVIALISALAFHEITTQIPHDVYISIERNTRKPKLEYPPIKVIINSQESYSAGIETYEINKVRIRVFSAEKTIVDCFKYRNKIGLDTAIESLKLYKERKKVNIKKLIEYARICRIEKVMLPYLQAIL